MKNILCYWIIIQLLVIGWAGAGIHNQMVKGEWECSEPFLYPYWFTMSFPLTFFTTPNDFEKNYCKFELNMGRDGDCCCDNCAEDLEEEDINFKPCNMMVEE